jgi:hypothetical protein
MKDNFVEHQIVKMNKSSEISSGKQTLIKEKRKQLFLFLDNQAKPSMIAQLASLQRLKEVKYFS